MSRPNHGPRLRPNKDGIYYIHWSENGRSKRRSTGTSNLPEAQKILAGFLLELERHAENRMTVGAAIDYYEANHMHKVTDQRNAKRRLAYFRTILGEDTFVDELTEEDFTRYRRERRRTSDRGEDLSETTIKRELTQLLAVINFLVRNRKLDNMKAPKIDLPPDNNPKDRWLTKDEANHLLKTAQRDRERLTVAHRFVAIALGTGKRRGVIEGLKWFQVDLKNRMIDFREPGRAETKKRKGRSPISKWLLPILERAYREKRSEYVLDRHADREKLFKSLTKRAGMPDVTPHTLRHTCGTWMAQAGASMWQIAGVLGCTIATAERNYLHHSPAHLRGVVDLVSPDVMDLAQGDVQGGST